MAISNTFAQKTYVSVYKDGNTYLVGNVPADMKSNMKYSNSHGYITNDAFMDVVNMLGERGYEVEFTFSSGYFLMSKRSSGGYNAVRGIEINEDEDVTEVARYNLQGLPVKEHDKGVQIIVYSNYTTKTVIVQ